MSQSHQSHFTPFTAQSNVKQPRSGALMKDAQLKALLKKTQTKAAQVSARSVRTVRRE